MCVADTGTTETLTKLIKGNIYTEVIFPHYGRAPLSIDVTDAMRRLGLARSTLSPIVNGHSGISTGMAIRLERARVGTARSRIALRGNYELSRAEERKQPAIRPLQSPAPPDGHPKPCK